MLNFTFKVTVSLTRERGKFATRDELAQQMIDALTDANPDSLEGDSGGEYTIGEWNVEET